MSLADLKRDINRQTRTLNASLDTGVQACVEGAERNYHRVVDELIENGAYVLVIGYIIRNHHQDPKRVYQKLSQALRRTQKGLTLEDIETDAERRALDEFLALGCAVRVTEEDGRTRFIKDALLEFLDEEELNNLDLNRSA